MTVNRDTGEITDEPVEGGVGGVVGVGGDGAPRCVGKTSATERAGRGAGRSRLPHVRATTTTGDNPVTSIVQALTAVMTDVGAVSKHDRNTAQNFSFRGIDAVVNAVSPALRAHGVVVVPQVEHVERTTVEVGSKRTLMGHVAVTVRYRFHGPDGDHVDAVVVGEAMDAGDKATPKAMSVAFRTALLQALCLPTDDPDPDAASYERAPVEDETVVAQARERIAAATTADELASVAEWLRAQIHAGLISHETSVGLRVAWDARHAETVVAA